MDNFFHDSVLGVPSGSGGDNQQIKIIVENTL